MARVKQETEGWLTDDELQQALGDGDIPAHFVDLLAAEVRDRRAEERERQAQRSYTQTFQRYEIAREVLAGRLVSYFDEDNARSVKDEADLAVEAADALLAALRKEARA